MLSLIISPCQHTVIERIYVVTVEFLDESDDDDQGRKRRRRSIFSFGDIQSALSLITFDIASIVQDSTGLSSSGIAIAPAFTIVPDQDACTGRKMICNKN